MGLWLAAWFVGAAAGAQHPLLDAARENHIGGETQAALTGYREFLELIGSETIDRPLFASAYNNVCVIENQLGDFQAALSACEQALELRQGLGDDQRTGRTLNNLGLAQQYLGRYGEARSAFAQALDINMRLGDVSAQAINHSNLGLVAAAIGDYGSALGEHRQVEALADAHPGAPWAARQRRIAWINQGVVLEKLGAHRKALDIYLRWVDGKDDAALDPRQRATALVNMGTLYRNLGDPIKAEDSYERALQVLEDEGDVAGQANAALNLGQVRHLNLGALEAAEGDYLRALALARQSGDRLGEIQALGLLGRLLLEGARYSEAKLRFEACRGLAQDSQIAEGLWSALLGLAQISLRTGDAEAALNALRLAMAEVEKTRAGVADRTLRGGFFADHRVIYEAAVTVLWELQSQTPEGDFRSQALEVVERAKQRELAEAIAHNEVNDAELQIRGVERLSIEFFFAAGALYAFVIEPAGSVHMTRHKDAADIEDRATRVWTELAAQRSPLAEDVRQLSETLVAATGLGDAIARSPEFERAAVRLGVAADGRLRSLPFEILALQGTDGEALIDRAIVSYSPSSVLASGVGMRAIARSASRFVVIGIGDPEFESATALDHAAIDTASDEFAPQARQRLSLEPLPHSAAELKNALRVMPGEHRLLLGDLATVDGLVEATSSGARVLHIAAHTLIDEQAGGVVVLAPNEEDDGLLAPEEIARLDANVDLTILAACRSALGDSRELGALSSLAGAFLAAGSAAVVATQWDAGDSNSAAFMAQVYPRLARGQSPDVALTQVKRHLRNDPRWSAPHLWAGWVLYGESQPVVARWRRWLPMVWGGLLFLVVACTVWGLSQLRRPGD